MNTLRAVRAGTAPKTTPIQPDAGSKKENTPRTLQMVAAESKRVLREVAQASVPFSPSLGASRATQQPRPGRSEAPRTGPFRAGAAFPRSPQLLHGFSGGGVSLSLPHHRTATAAD